VARRRALFGENRLPQPKRPGPVIIYLRQFANPLVYLLLAATVVSVIVGELTDAIFIFIVLQLNAVIGTYQEWRAETAAQALDQLIRNVVVVRRDGARREVEAAELVPGDIVELESGTRVPADLRLLGSRELSVDESLLTGESTPVSKQPEAELPPEIEVADRSTMLFAGSTVLIGRARGVVVATGGTTEIGRIAQALVAGELVPPPLVQRLARFSRVIGVATMVLIGVIAAAQAAQGVPLLTVFLVAVALAVAAIPEGLPVAITVALAIATHRMVRRNVIVRALPAVEGLGACTMIASDKTGTLTRNELTIKRVLLHQGGPALVPVEVGGDGYQPDGCVTRDRAALDPEQRSALRRLAESGALCNEASIDLTHGGSERLGDTVDLAFLVLAAKLELAPEALRAAARGLGAIPYEPRRRYGAVFVEDNEAATAKAAVHVKGAPEVVLPLCAGCDRDAVHAQADALAEAGYRVLAVARGTTTRRAAEASDSAALQGLEFVGLVGLIDPIRAEVPQAVRRCREAGIAVSMITGDHPATALAIARELEIAERPEQVITGQQLAEVEQHPERLDRAVAEARIFARVDPVQKLTIVQAMQRNGHVVAVTGDGVNDAPALSAADLGVAMGKGGTDVARGAADLILTDDNFASIVGGIEEGRVAYDNVRKVIYLLVTTGFAEIVLFLLAIVGGLPLPLFAVQLLWLNLVTNGIQHVGLALERGEPGVLQRRPRPPKQGLFDRRMVLQVLISGSYMGAAGFLFYDWCLERGVAEAEARNLLLLLMVLFENAQALNARSERRSVFRVPLAANPFLIFGILGAQAIHVVAMYAPGLSTVLDTRAISFIDWALVCSLALSLIVVAELQKKLIPLFPGTGRN